MDSDQKLTEILQIVKTERDLNNHRFSQLSHAIHTLDQKMGGVEKRLTDKIDHVYHALSEDIQAIAGDQEKLAHRVKTLERKSA